MDELQPSLGDSAPKLKNRGNAGKGRIRGSQNKIPRAFKEALLLAFEELGGVNGLVRWGRNKRNRTAFYQICARLIPHEVVGPGKDGAHVVKTIVDELHP